MFKSLIVAILISSFALIMYRLSSMKKPLHKNGASVYKYSKAWFYISLVCTLIFALAFLGALISKNYVRVESKYITVLVFGFFAILGCLSILSVKFMAILLKKDNSLTYINMWGKETNFQWADISRITFSILWHGIRIKIKDGKTVILPLYFNSSRKFLDIVKSNVNERLGLQVDRALKIIGVAFIESETIKK